MADQVKCIAELETSNAKLRAALTVAGDLRKLNFGTARLSSFEVSPPHFARPTATCAAFVTQQMHQAKRLPYEDSAALWIGAARSASYRKRVPVRAMLLGLGEAIPSPSVSLSCLRSRCPCSLIRQF
jgi:hypothetical protein